MTGPGSTARPPRMAPGCRGSPTGSPRSAVGSTSGASQAPARPLRGACRREHGTAGHHRPGNRVAYRGDRHRRAVAHPVAADPRREQRRTDRLSVRRSVWRPRDRRHAHRSARPEPDRMDLRRDRRGSDRCRPGWRSHGSLDALRRSVDGVVELVERHRLRGRDVRAPTLVPPVPRRTSSIARMAMGVACVWAGCRDLARLAPYRSGDPRRLP